MKNKTLKQIIAELVENHNYNYDEIIAELAEEARKILDEDYLEEY